MRIFNDATSPFGRKAVACAMERRIALEEVFIDLGNAAFLDRWNPLRQIPTLVTSEEEAIYDSDVIVQFLDTLHGGEPLIPPAQSARILTRMSLANGLMEATLSRLVETRREPGQRSDTVIAKMTDRIWRALLAIEHDLAALAATNGTLRADQITTAVALGYADFRFTEAWRERHPALGQWYAGIAARPSMTLTAPTRTSPVPAADIARG